MTPDQLYQFGNQPAGEIIHRLPPMRIDPVTFSADQLADPVPWSMEVHKIPEVQRLTLGENMKVAILDTGAADHPDLPKPIFAENFSRSPTPWDRQGHATHVAGTLGARGKLKGVAPAVQIGYCKVLGDDGSGASSGIARGFYFAISQRVNVISASLGSSMDDPQIARAVKDAIEAGILVICAAGNEGVIIDRFTGKPINTVGYPARHAVAIASYNRDGEISDYSSRGPEVDVAFPGENILSTWPGGGYKQISGTSMACPFASGVAVLRLSYQTANPSIKPIRNNADLEREFRAAAEDRGPAGRDTDWGDGVVDVMKFVKGGLADATPTPKPPVLPGIPIGPVVIDWPVSYGDRTGILISLKG